MNQQSNNDNCQTPSHVLQAEYEIQTFQSHHLETFDTAYSFGDVNRAFDFLCNEDRLFIKHIFLVFHLDQKQSSLVNQKVSCSFVKTTMIMAVQYGSFIKALMFYLQVFLSQCFKLLFGFCFS